MFVYIYIYIYIFIYIYVCTNIYIYIYSYSTLVSPYDLSINIILPHYPYDSCIHSTKKHQDLPPEACAQLAPALVKLRSQSETLAQGVFSDGKSQGVPMGNWGKPRGFPWKVGKP